MKADRYLIVSVAERPDLVPVVADWLWTGFGNPSGRSYEEILETVTEGVTAEHIPRAFVLLVDGIPKGTASLTAQDLDQRPDLTPWLAGVYVAPEARRQGLAAYLVAAVEEECRRQSIATLWLFTRTAEHIYRRLGWTTTEMFERKGNLYALMRRDLNA